MTAPMTREELLAELRHQIESAVMTTLEKSAPGISETMRHAMVYSIMLKLSKAIPPEPPQKCIPCAGTGRYISRFGYNDPACPDCGGTGLEGRKWLSAPTPTARGDGK